MDECKKSKFRTANDADFQIEQLRRRKGNKFVPMRKYHCKVCDTWHITSNPGGVDPYIKNLEKTIEDCKKQIGELTRAVEKRDNVIKDLQKNHD